MKITSMEVLPLLIPYRNAYETANGVQQHGNKVLVKLHTDEGLIGIGETCHINPYYTGEHIETIAITLARYFRPHIVGKDPFLIDELLRTPRKFTNTEYSHQFAVAALDNALYDLLGKILGVPVYTLLGGLSRSTMRVARSIPAMSPDEMAKAAVRLKDEGYALITFKGGFGPKVDLERLAAVREAVGPDFPLEVDFNQAYLPDVAIPLIRKMQRFGIEAVEQPGPWWDIEGMAEVRQAIDVSVIAHESVFVPMDVMKIARRRAADVICLTLARCAGFRSGQKMIAIAEAAGMGVSIASEHPAGPGTAAIRHFVAANPQVQEPIGYGSPSERFEGDILTQELTIKDGIVEVPTGVGLGVELDDAAVERYTAKHIAAMLS